jgi:hypothetical protein
MVGGGGLYGGKWGPFYEIILHKREPPAKRGRPRLPTRQMSLNGMYSHVVTLH